MSPETKDRAYQEQVKRDNKTIDRMVVAWVVIIPIVLVIIGIAL